MRGDGLVGHVVVHPGDPASSTWVQALPLHTHVSLKSVPEGTCSPPNSTSWAVAGSYAIMPAHRFGGLAVAFTWAQPTAVGAGGPSVQVSFFAPPEASPPKITS